jgi:hypothetical protein
VNGNHGYKPPDGSGCDSWALCQTGTPFGGAGPAGGPSLHQSWCPRCTITIVESVRHHPRAVSSLPGGPLVTPCTGSSHQLGSCLHPLRCPVCTRADMGSASAPLFRPNPLQYHSRTRVSACSPVDIRPCQAAIPHGVGRHWCPVAEVSASIEEAEAPGPQGARLSHINRIWRRSVLRNEAGSRQRSRLTQRVGMQRRPDAAYFCDRTLGLDRDSSCPLCCPTVAAGSVPRAWQAPGRDPAAPAAMGI